MALGLAIILKDVLKVDLHRILIALFLIFIGVKILLKKSKDNANELIFGERTYTSLPNGSSEFKTIFGESTYDFRNHDFSDVKEIEFKTVFGESKILLPQDINVRVDAKAVFGSVELPNNNKAVFGSAFYKSQGMADTMPKVNIKVKVVFGEVGVVLVEQKDEN